MILNTVDFKIHENSASNMIMNNNIIISYWNNTDTQRNVTARRTLSLFVTKR